MNSASPITVVPVDNPRQMEDFLRLPWRLYADDPLWVPPLLGPQRKFLNPRQGPFFENGEVRYFLAYQGGQPVGRLSAHINHLYNQYHDPDTGFFGFYESVPDLAVTEALFAAGGDYLRHRGKKHLVGPLNFSVYDEMGLLVEGFDTMPALFQTHNPSYYRDFLEALGFRQAFDFLAFQIDNRNVDLAVMERQIEKIMSGHSLRFAPFHWRDYTKWAEAVYELFNDAWQGNWGHVPLNRQQFFKFFHELKPLIRPELVNLVVEGERLIGFGFAVNDINPLVREFNGRLTPWGKLRLFYAARYAPIHKARAMVVGVRKHYRHLRLHHAMIFKGYIHLVRHTPCQVCDLSLVPGNLRPWIKTLELFGARRYKTFRVYAKDL